MLKALSVSELNGFVSKIFEAEELLHYIKVYGEISGLSLVRGNLYFNLKDENSLIQCIMFGASGVDVKEGDQVIVTGGLRYYAKGGRLNLYVTGIAPYGSGALYQKFLELKNKLELEGVFSDKYKKELPKTINTIGVITSQTGAVLHDIITVSHRRNPLLNIVVYPARVQGDGAEQTIIKGLKYFNNKPNIDVIIIARGGGSIEDLQPFNTESLAREIIKVSQPVVSAVGHETDFTICDFASSLRGATPSEAAELVARNLFEGRDKFETNLDKIFYLVQHLFDEKYNKIDNLLQQMTLKNDKVLMKNHTKFSNILHKFISVQPLLPIENKFVIEYNKMISLNPESILKRGYARVSKNNKLINGISNISEKDNIVIEFLNGKIQATVDNVIGEK